MRKYLVVSALLIFILTSCAKKEEVKNEENISLKSVFAIYPKQKEEDEQKIFNGISSSKHEIKLSFKVNGNIDKFNYSLGDEVKKGSLIAKLDSKPYELKVSQVEYILKEAKSGLENAKINYDRVKKLYINQNASSSDLDNSRAKYEALSSKIKNIKKELEYAKLQLSYTKLYSPIDGYISYKFAQENENTAQGRPIVLINDKNIDEVTIHIPQTFINNIKTNDKVKVLFDLPNVTEPIFAKITEISKSTGLKSKTYKVIAKLEKSSKLIKVGMSADVYFNFSKNTEKQTLLIPPNSVLNDKKGYFVYVLKEKDKNYIIKKQEVKVGKLKNFGYEIKEGLTLSDLVLKAGMSEVYENMNVELGNEKELRK